MKFIAALFWLLLVGTTTASAQTRMPGGAPATGGTPPQDTVRAEMNPNFLACGGEYPLLNLMKSDGTSWGGGAFTPADLDSNGYPNYAFLAAQKGVQTVVCAPSQAERPGNYVVTWTGAGLIRAYDEKTSGQTNVAKCTGSSGASACDNTGCSPMVGGISGLVLTITNAPKGSRCGLVIGQPISGPGVRVSQFGTPTMITGSAANGATCGGSACTGNGGNGTYLLNFSQAVAPVTTLYPGGRLEVSVGLQGIGLVPGGVTTLAGGFQISIAKGAHGPISGNTPSYLGVYHIDDEPTYWTGELLGTLFKQRMKEGNFAVFRDMNWVGYSAPCTTWATRKPTTYYTYSGPEPRAILYPGANPTYALVNGANEFDLSLPTYDAGTTYAANQSVYRVGSIYVSRQDGNAGHTPESSPTWWQIGPADKQLLVFSWPNNVISGPSSKATATFSGHTMTVTNVASGHIAVGSTAAGIGPGYINVTGVGSGTGGTGTYTVDVFHNFTGTITASGVGSAHFDAQIIDKTMVVRAGGLHSGSIQVGATLTAGSHLMATTTVTAQVSGTPGAVGVYNIDTSLNLGSMTFNPTPVQMLNLNGTGAVPVLESGGTPVYYNPIGAGLVVVMYDMTLGGWINFQHDRGLGCGIPPEAFAKINDEMGTKPWIVAFWPALDPMTDYYTQYAIYLRDNYPSMHPEFEANNEVWNFVGTQGCYASAKSLAYIRADTAHAWHPHLYCGYAGDTVNWTGKIASTLGQAISAVYGADTNRYDVIMPVKTNAAYSNGPFGTGFYDNALLASAYVGQSMDAQPAGCAGFGAIQTSCPTWQKSPAYNWITRISVNQYWSPYFSSQQKEVSDAYNYFYGNPTQKAMAMADYMQGTVHSSGDHIPLATYYRNWYTWVTHCSTQNISPCNVKGMAGYEGTFTTSNGQYSSDRWVAITGAMPSGDTCVLRTSDFDSNGSGGNGAVAGMTIRLSGASGGKWSTVNGNDYTVQAGPTSTNIPINLDCSDLGTLASATLTYVGSVNYVNYLLRNSYLSQQAHDLIVSQVYRPFTSNGGINPSQFTLGGSLGVGYSWTTWSFDIYGFFKMATCTACTVSGTTLTLGGTIDGIFSPGQVLFGKYITGPGVSKASVTASITGKTLHVSTVSSGTLADGDVISGVGITPQTTIVNANGNTTIGDYTLNMTQPADVATETIRIGAPYTTIIGSCVAKGTGPCGSNSGDTLQISKVPTQPISPGENIASFVPPVVDAAGKAMNSPISTWPAIRAWDGGFLLRRDVDPAANYNAPAFLAEAA